MMLPFFVIILSLALATIGSSVSDEITIICGDRFLHVSPKNASQIWRINVAGDAQSFTDQYPCAFNHAASLPLNRCGIVMKKEKFATFYKFAVLFSKLSEPLMTAEDPVFYAYCVYPNVRFFADLAKENRFSLTPDQKQNLRDKQLLASFSCDYEIQPIADRNHAFPIALRTDHLVKHIWNCTNGKIVRIKSCQIENTDQKISIPALTNGCPVANRFPMLSKQHYAFEGQVQILAAAHQWITNPVTTMECEVDVCFESDHVCKALLDGFLKQQQALCGPEIQNENETNENRGNKGLPHYIQSYVETVTMKSNIVVLDNIGIPIYFETSTF